MSDPGTVRRTLPEASRNTLLRRVDWRFLLRNTDRPRTVDLAAGNLSAGVRLVADLDGNAQRGTADLVVLGRPTRSALSRARAALRPGGELYCEWRVPGLAAPRRVRQRLQRAGFVDVRVQWAWPLPQRSTPLFWLPADAPAAMTQFLTWRPARSHTQNAVRALWRALARAGLLAPVCAMAQRPRGAWSDASDGQLEREDGPRTAGTPPSRTSWVLLTGGQRSMNKVIGIPFADDGLPEPLVVKFARVPEADAALKHEASVLRALAVERPGLPGLPRVLALGRRAGRVALAETAIHGEPLIAALTPATFATLAQRVTKWLVELAEFGASEPRADWWPRLVEAPLDDFAQRFGSVIDRGTLARVRDRLDRLPDLPAACEHRDCAPWNIVLTDSGAPALLDWESAERRGLPGLDLVYFLANSAFVLDGALDSGGMPDTYCRLLDRTTPFGAVAAACFNEYGTRLGAGAEMFEPLRLLCWIVHCRSDHCRLQRDAAGQPDPHALRTSPFLRLVLEELRRPQL